MTHAAAGYLARLGLDERPPATVATLFEIHRRHAESIPYENLHTMLGSPPAVDVPSTLARVAAGGNAGYCFHHNGVLTAALRSLGYDVVPAWGHNWDSAAERADVYVGHLALSVRGLPTAENPGGVWWPDVGCGDGLHEPLPLIAGTYRQGPFTYRLDVRADGWTFHHDPQGSFGAVDLFDEVLTPEQERGAHRKLTAPDDGAYARKLVVQRRLPDAAETLRGCQFTRTGMRPEQVGLTAYDDWRDALRALGISLRGVDGDALRGLFDRSLAQHREWLASRRPS
ncbi:arylamine N-acetyltransferase family protein [Promicromonospora kroppenstedtii]|uniref:arylamine N-acetyltransferase family protein n=1 Tax=Promicromonospora kroppenstedtii TaxID=440482 RepID=UPI0004B45AAA|nr:arylamine N-acetyltransferase [Promicromonospora kroppenstedtii]